MEYAPIDRESGQDCEGAYSQAPMRSLLTWSVGTEGHPENESTDHFEGTNAGQSWGQAQAGVTQ